ncbi:MAG: protein translocase subunit SecD, partial [Chloroflexota bacterium]|nr:protein translocase subunit SecD [Chloroflexota bacterium]
ILYWFGSTFGASIIRGFAITLAIGVLVSMFTAIVVTRTLLRFVVSMPAVRDIRLWGIAQDEAGSMAPQRTAGGAALGGTRAR